MHHGKFQEAQSLQNDGFSHSAQGVDVLHTSHDLPPQEAIAYIRNFFEQDDQDASLSSFGELSAFHTKASEFAAILKEGSPALSLNLSSPIHSRQQALLLQPQEDVSTLESLTKCSIELVGKGMCDRFLLLNSLKSSHRLNCMPSKVLDVGLFRNLLSKPTILHEKEGDEVSGANKDVNGSIKHDEAQRIGSALKPRKDLSISKPRFHKYADMSISKLRHNGEYVNMKIDKAGLPMYIDLNDMLLQCCYAVGLNDTNAAKAVAWKVKQRTSPDGTAAERLAHYFVNALYARLAGIGWSLYRGHLLQHRPSFTQILEAKMKYMSSCPFTQASHLFSNETILRIAKGASKLVIIEYQFSGIQYPSLFEKLAALPGGPPKVHLIAMVIPHYSMPRPQTDVIFAAVEESGQRLAKYAALIKVPFHFTPWVGMPGKKDCHDFVSPKRLPREVFVAISTSFLRFVMDGILDPQSIRLKRFKNLCGTCPDVFIKGVVSGAYSTPFFSARFKEALFHFTCVFDILDTFIGRKNQDRLVFESEVLGKAIVNVVACEGALVSTRVVKYKQWQAVIEEAGMQQLDLNTKITYQVEGLLKRWHKDYMVVNDRKHLLLGWRGRTLYALSTWRSRASSCAMPS